MIPVNVRDNDHIMIILQIFYYNYYYRDWRGLAYLVNISSEKAAYIQMHPTKTTAVLEIWQQDRTATVGQLLSHLERLDRYDVYDDLCLNLKESIQNGDLVGK